MTSVGTYLSNILMTPVGTYLSNIIDIIIVSYVIYQLLILLRGTRAVQLLKGITVLVIIWLVSNFLNLSTLTWLMQNFFSVGILAIIIIFQPELRRALEQLGQRGFLGLSHQMEEELATNMVTEIAKAVSFLADHRIGALIVIERKTGLMDYIETGIKLEANLSSELLKNIFLPKTPLHDGAVILRGEVLVAASCYLPLSENRLISKELGTRHRAAIGITELSDAIVITVSEETGRVSLATQGHLETILSKEGIWARLLEELSSSTNKYAKPFWVLKGKGKQR